MKISLVQFDVKWLNPQANTQTVARLMDSTPDASLYVLPEMWATGFNTSPNAEMGEMGRHALEWMGRQAAARQCAIAGTLAVYEQAAEHISGKAQTWRNRFFFVFPDKSYAYYDKRNLFNYGGEHVSFVPGKTPVIVTWRGARFMLQTCYDLRFPENARNSLRQTYDVLLYAANWPSSRRRAWDTLLAARAIENQACCVGVNRTGDDPFCQYNGGSAAYDPYGRLLLQLHDREQAACITVNLEEMRAFREKFQVLR